MGNPRLALRLGLLPVTRHPPPANLLHEGGSREGSHYQPLDAWEWKAEGLQAYHPGHNLCPCPLPETGVLVPCTAWIGALKLPLGLLEVKQKCELAPD